MVILWLIGMVVPLLINMVVPLLISMVVPLLNAHKELRGSEIGHSFSTVQPLHKGSPLIVRQAIVHLIVLYPRFHVNKL
jgi:hypothetical protein